MTSWIEQAARRGILTTAYPARPTTEEELPETARAPRAGVSRGASSQAAGTCPVGAIRPTGLDQGRCIRCARCLPFGYRFDGPAEGARLRRSDLYEAPVPASGPATLVAPPLARLGRSLHVFLIDVGSCNACNLEILALANPYYDSQRLGIFFTNSPRHADVLLVVGVPTREMETALRRTYEAMPAPKAVVAVGACAISGGAFRGTSGLRDGVTDLVAVDLYVPGCPPTPVQVLDGLLELMGRARGPAEVA